MKAEVVWSKRLWSFINAVSNVNKSVSRTQILILRWREYNIWWDEIKLSKNCRKIQSVVILIVCQCWLGLWCDFVDWHFFNLLRHDWTLCLANPILPCVWIRCQLFDLFKTKMGKFQVTLTFDFPHFHAISTGSSFRLRKSWTVVLFLFK